MDTFKLIVFLFLFNIPNLLWGQKLNIDTTRYKPEELVEAVLISGSVRVKNISYKGSSKAVGHFSVEENSEIFPEGIILTTGFASNAPGPNKNIGKSGENYMRGDPDLQKLTSAPTYDAAILEFDFIPNSAVLRFEYIFGSEEYPEFVDSDFNDVFAFLISGKNPQGGFYDNFNIAQIPQTELPVTINNINHKRNSEFYIDNADGEILEYDGFTQTLSARAVLVPNETYHIKIGIADVTDGFLDSFVMLKAKSFISIPKPIIHNFCFADSTVFQLTDTTNIVRTRWEFGDPQSPNNVSDKLIAKHVFSSVGEFIISLSIKFKYGIQEEYLTDTVRISNRPEISIRDTFWICKGDSVAVAAPPKMKSYLWSNQAKSETIVLHEQGKYNLQIADSFNCIARDTFFVAYYPPISIDSVSIRNSCPEQKNGSALIHASGGVGTLRYGIDSVFQTSNLMNSLCSAEYTLVVSDSFACRIEKNITISQYPEIAIENIQIKDLLCFSDKNGEIRGKASGGFQALNYVLAEQDSNASGVFLALAANTYSLKVIDRAGCCVDTLVSVKSPDLLEMNVNFTEPDCENKNMSAITVNTSGGVLPYTIVCRDKEGKQLTDYSIVPSGYYTFTLTDNNQCECVLEVDIPKVDCKSELEMPNIFTPNSQNNAFFAPNSADYKNIKKYRMIIYNRWGEKLFESDDIRKGWNGQTKTIPQKSPAGIYFYYVTAEGWDDKIYEKKGYFYLIRNP